MAICFPQNVKDWKDCERVSFSFYSHVYTFWNSSLCFIPSFIFHSPLSLWSPLCTFLCSSLFPLLFIFSHFFSFPRLCFFQCIFFSYLSLMTLPYIPISVSPLPSFLFSLAFLFFFALYSIKKKSTALTMEKNVKKKKKKNQSVNTNYFFSVSFWFFFFFSSRQFSLSMSCFHFFYFCLHLSFLSFLSWILLFIHTFIGLYLFSISNLIFHIPL